MKILLITSLIAISNLMTFSTVEVKSFSTESSIVREKFSEVSLETLPQVVYSAFKKAYPDGKLVKAFINTKEEYKLEVVIEGADKNLFVNSAGNWIHK
ncbi:hypothetical protein [Flavobacterium sp.]|jgi:hypothetical protein|uniref:hypothetical protein n=1 Tax=Flavobacterium sp. TaxID=239 RepID=UPI0040483315